VIPGFGSHSGIGVGGRMKRRDLLAITAVVTGAAAGRPPSARAQRSLRRSAVVIGVNKTGQLPVLNAAGSGATQVADWLGREGFEVKRFTDDRGPVKVGDLFEAVSELVNRGTLDQLVVYFSGHGFLNAFTEYWLLSGAPQNPNEAVNLVESVTLARESAIANVIFISDACRSTPDSLGASRVRGSLIFPNSTVSRNIRSNVDIFFAALPGNPAAEVPVDKSTANFQGVFTSCLLDAFHHPATSMVRTVDGIRVVPNRNLKGYLEIEVVKRAEEKSIHLNQRPDATVESDDMAYIGRAEGLDVSSATPPPANTTIRDIARVQLERAGAGDIVALRTVQPISPAESLVLSTFLTAQSNILAATGQAQKTSQFGGSSGGFKVSGAQLSAISAGRNAKVQLDSNDRTTATIDFSSGPASSVAIRFGNGSGTVLAGLRRFMCSVVVNEFGVSSVNYIRIGAGSDERIDALHAAVATAAQFGVFRVEGEPGAIEKNAASFAAKIRVGKDADPALGLYAAYAYAQAGLVEQVRSVGSFLRGTLQVDLFDVAMLGRELSRPALLARGEVFPSFPMLAQGWNFLRALQVDIAPEIDRLRDHLRRSLWTTFDSEGMSIVESLLRSGRVQ
jgi:hypothetical protein